MTVAVMISERFIVAAPMHLESRRKVAHGRCVPPGETIARIEALLRPRFDFRTHDERVSAHLHWTALFLDDDPGFRAMGKGITPEFSRAGALAEAAEWLTAREVDRLPGHLAAPQHKVENALPIDSLVSHVANATPPVLERIKSLDAAWHWVDGWSLRHAAPRKVPLSYVRLVNGPNGKAAGNCLEEAVVHAVNEIFERRAHITVLRDRLVVPTIDARSIKHPILRAHLAFFRDRRIDVTLKDLSFGGALPCVGAYFHDPHVPEDYQFHHFFKVGSSFDREEALLRVFTEYVQGRRANEFLDGPGDPELAPLLKPDFRRLRTRGDDCDNFLSAFLFGMVPYRRADFLREGDLIPFDPHPGYGDCLDDIRHALEICEALDKDLLVVDLTDPRLGFPVVQVVIPGYSDVLPFHPPHSPALFRPLTRSEVLHSFSP